MFTWSLQGALEKHARRKQFTDNVEHGFQCRDDLKMTGLRLVDRGTVLTPAREKQALDLYTPVFDYVDKASIATIVAQFNA